MKVFAYSRVSTGKQSISLDAQRETMRRWFEHEQLNEQGYELVVCDPEEAVSGRVRFANRPVGGKVMREAEPGDCVVFAKLDRGFRSALDVLSTVEQWRVRKVRVVFLDLKVDTNTPIGRFFLATISAVAELERDLISERTREAARANRRKGKPISPSRWGFKHVGPRGAKKEVPDEDLRAIGRQIVEWKDKGFSWTEISAHLMRNNVPKPNRRKKTYKDWTVMAVRIAYAATKRFAKEANGPAQGPPDPEG